MQSLHSARARLRHRELRSSGFTLVELMVAISILGIIAAAAFAGFRQNEYRGQFKRFLDDCAGALVTARNYAIDEQTRVRVAVQADRIDVTAWEDDANAWNLLQVVSLETTQDGLLVGGNACIHGLDSGVQTPAQSVAQTPPGACSGAVQTLEFQPDGTFTDPDNTFTSLANTGATLWLGNHQVSGIIQYSFIQIFPGGLIRTFEKTVE